MYQTVNNWMQNLVVAIAITTIVEMLLPDNSNKKYIKMVCSIYILFVILSPILNINKIDFDNLANKYVETSVSPIDETENISNIYIDAYENEIKNELINNGFNIKNVNINLNNVKEEINNIEIETYYISEQEKNIVEDYIKSKHQISKITIK